MQKLLETIKKGNLEQFKTLINQNSTSIKEATGTIILSEAIRNNNLEIVRFLIELGVEVNDEDRILSDDETPLAIAASKGNLEIVRLLLSAGATVNIPLKDPEYWTPLMCGVSSGNLNLVKLLVQSGADVNETRDGGNFALIIAARENFQEIVDYLYPLTIPELRNSI